MSVRVNVRNLSIFMLMSLLTACGGASSSGSPSIADPLDGNYYLAATSLTETDINGGTCGDGSGTLNVIDETLGGNILTTNGELFDIVGTIDSSGRVTGGFAQSGQNAARFEGSISGSRGTGTWNDLYECSGTWEAIKSAD